MKTFFVYIMTNKPHGALYIGVTNSLERRRIEHKTKQSAFTKKYNLHKCVYFEEFSSINDAIKREKQLKNWRRQWKIDLIEGMNPGWSDLFK